MRHRKKTLKLGRKTAHREAMLANLVCSLIAHNRVSTTVARGKAARSLADKMVTLGKKGTLHHRRQALAVLRQPSAVAKLFSQIAPRFKERAGGYTRIVRLSNRPGDAAPMAVLEWVESIASPVPSPESGKAGERKANTKT